MSRTATMAYDDPRDRVAPYFSVDEGELAPKPALLPVGWESATEYHRLKKTLGPGLKQVEAREEAIRAVLERARQVLRHQNRPMVTHTQPFMEEPGGELDLDASLEARSPHGWRAEDIVVTTRQPWRADLVLICDLSLSMTGDKLAMLAVATSVLALSMPTEDLGLVVFDTNAHIIKPLGERLSPKDFVRRLLDVPAQGYTCMEAGLKAGLSCLRASRAKEKAGVLISDGVYNVGWDPRPLAPRFEHLHVIKIGAGDRDKGLCRDLAEGGRGRMALAETYEDLPEVTHRLIRSLVRGRV